MRRRALASLPAEIGGARWRLAPGADPEAAAAVIARAMAALESGAPNLKTGRRKRLHPLALSGGPEPDHLLKVNAYRPLAGFLHWGRASKSVRELEVACALGARSLPAIVPLAAGEKRAGGRLLECYLLVAHMKDVTDLGRLWFDAALEGRARRDLVRTFGAFCRRVHDAGFFQDDFAPNNFLLGSDARPGFVLVDFERARLERRLSRGERAWMLAKLDRALSGAFASDRLRFLEGYAGNRRDARAWWQAIARVSSKLARRDFRRLRRNATTEGRRYRIVNENGFTGFARRDASLDPAPPERESGNAIGRVVPGNGRWDVECGRCSEKEGRRIWVVANLLWERGGLCPRPRFLLRRGDETFLRLEREAEAVGIVDAPDPDAARRAVSVLLVRLGSLGEVIPALDPRSVALKPDRRGALRAQLLDPRAFSFGSDGADPRGIRSFAAKLAAAARAPGGPAPDSGNPGREAADR